MPLPYEDRMEAGRVLAEELLPYANRRDVLVLGLPRGGVPVAYEVAVRLNVPLDIFVVRKLGVPGHEELAMGAIASGGIQVLNSDVVARYAIPASAIAAAAARETKEVERRESAFRGGRPPLDVQGRTLILVDDGLATGSTMRAAVNALRQRKPAKIVAAVPVAAQRTCIELSAVVDELICVETPESFQAVGQWYHDFSDPTEEQIRALLERAASRRNYREP
ncbi:MAG: phosphoribosyltransferase [Bryobacteraceae bacterium]|nr:phosphoribosyltransferase [Bryobacteraceae bacterium]